MLLYLRCAGLALALASVLGGCATLAPHPADPGINDLLAARHGPVVSWSAAGQAPSDLPAIEGWLAKPMTRDAAVQVAMLRSPRLQQEYARLGLARAEVLEALEIDNPRLSLSRLSLSPGAGRQRTAGLSLPLADLLLLPVKARLAGNEFERARLDIAAAVLGVAADVEAAWYEHVTASQVAGMRLAVAEAAAASAELAQRFHAAGNISELQLRQEQAAASEARIDAIRARAEAGRTRLQLNTLLGLSGNEASWASSDRLPLPVRQEDAPGQLRDLARSGNLELLAARQQAAVLAQARDITRGLRWFGGSEVGYEREREADGSRLRGPTLELELPIFNQGQARLARADALLAEARARVALAELSTDNAVRLGSEAVRALSEVVAIHRQALVPQRESIVARRQEQQNFMLIGVFELIQAKMQEYDAYQSYLEAVRDYWLARVELTRVVGQRLPSAASEPGGTPSVEEILNPEAAKEDDEHSHHHHGGKP